ncbi:hypothetical protein [Altererythrobacter sp. CC-YST694]|uniref:hypothetical protein n=1 Tax=Altererythrobacter sp. CC-YST694 TaxID=2755038 RepID=UPI001D01E0A9|nr:hypothetical protein [Altererythrobacter sp. CC-YST694]
MTNTMPAIRSGSDLVRHLSIRRTKGEARGNATATIARSSDSKGGIDQDAKTAKPMVRTIKGDIVGHAGAMSDGAKSVVSVGRERELRSECRAAMAILSATGSARPLPDDA